MDSTSRSTCASYQHHYPKPEMIGEMVLSTYGRVRIGVEVK